MSVVRISAPELRHTGDHLEYSVSYSFGSAGRGVLWYRVAAAHAELVSDRADAALVGLLIPAMLEGGDLHVEGPVTDELIHRLHHGYQGILRAVIPTLRPVSVIAERAAPAGDRARGVATGFSAGVDSFTVLADHHYDEGVPGRMKITHLLFNNVGSHGRGEWAANLFRDRYARAARIVDALDLPFVAVDSNLDDAFPSRKLNFQATHTPRNASVALLLQTGIGTWLYASGVPHTAVHVGPIYDMSYTDPVALPLLSTTALHLESSGGEYRRFDKTLRIADIPDTYNSLDVCVRDDLGGNCSMCWKCLRTLAALDIAGSVDRYHGVFDLDVYARRRNRYLGVARLSHDPLVRELYEEARRRGFEVPRAPLRHQLFARCDRLLQGRLDRLIDGLGWWGRRATRAVRSRRPSR